MQRRLVVADLLRMSSSDSHEPGTMDRLVAAFAAEAPIPAPRRPDALEHATAADPVDLPSLYRELQRLGD